MTVQPDALHSDEDAELTDTEGLEQELLEGEDGEEPDSQDGAASPKEAPEDDPERARALETGWKPREEWPGEPPKGFIDDPAEWNRRQDTLAVANRRLEDELKKVNAGVDQKVARATDRAVKAAKAAFDRQLKAEREGLEADWDAAIANSQNATEIHQRLGAKRKALSEHDAAAEKAREAEFAEPEEEQSAPGDLPEAYVEFVKDNSSWYGKNAGITARAMEIAVEIDKDQVLGRTPLKTKFAEVERRIREEYADYPAFRAARRTAPKVTTVATNGSRGLNGAGAAPKMTDEDRAAFEIIFKQGAYGPPRTTDKKKAMAEYLEDTREES